MLGICKFLSSEVTLSGTANTIYNGTLIRLVNTVNQHHHLTQTYANGVTKFTFTIPPDSYLIVEKNADDGLLVDSGSDVFANWIAYKN